MKATPVQTSVFIPVPNAEFVFSVNAKEMTMVGVFLLMKSLDYCGKQRVYLEKLFGSKFLRFTKIDPILPCSQSWYQQGQIEVNRILEGWGRITKRHLQ